jgi:tetratricopeptide (TPR) repeat protein
MYRMSKGVAGLIVIAVLLAFCLPTDAMSMDFEEMVSRSGVTDEKVKKGLKKYLGKRNQKAFAVNPITMKSYAWASWRRQKKTAKQWIAFRPWYLLFAENREYVWDEEYPRYMASSVGQGRKLRYEGDYEGAIPKFEDALKDDTDLWYKYGLLGDVYFMVGEAEKAHESFKRSIELRKKHNGFMHRFGEVQLALGDVDGARESSEIIEKMEGMSGLREHLEFGCFLVEGKYAEAAQVYGEEPKVGMRLDDVAQGIALVTVFKNSPPYFAGLRVGDVLISLNGRSMVGADMKAYGEVSKSIPAGAVVKARFLRDGKEYSTQYVRDVTIGEGNLREPVPVN